MVNGKGLENKRAKLVKMKKAKVSGRGKPPDFTFAFYLFTFTFLQSAFLRMKVGTSISSVRVGLTKGRCVSSPGVLV